MSKKVAVIESEYTGLASMLKSAHTDCMDELDQVMEKLRSLTGIDGMFYATNLSPNIARLDAELASIKSIIEDAFSTNEESIKSYTELIADYDVLD